MHMSLIAKVTYVICEWCECYPFNVQDVVAVVTVAGKDASLLINSVLFQLHSNCLFKLASRLQLLGDTFSMYRVFDI